MPTEQLSYLTLQLLQHFKVKSFHGAGTLHFLTVRLSACYWWWIYVLLQLKGWDDPYRPSGGVVGSYTRSRAIFYGVRSRVRGEDTNCGVGKEQQREVGGKYHITTT